MTELHTITRRIEIDAGHRVPDHRSKCCSPHGHRYVVEAECTGPLASDGEQTGMVLDFGFVKDIMMKRVHAKCDHAFIFAWWDELSVAMFLMPNTGYAESFDELNSLHDFDRLAATARHHDGGCFTIVRTTREGQVLRYYVTSFTPTAENLARHWFQCMEQSILDASGGRAQLEAVRVWETPNCVAEYRRDGLAR